jgi:hypothetical protein
MKITPKTFSYGLEELKSNEYNRIFTSVFALLFPLLYAPLGEIVNKIMISLSEIYYPSNIGLGISEDDVQKLSSRSFREQRKRRQR